MTSNASKPAAAPQPAAVQPSRRGFLKGSTAAAVGAAIAAYAIPNAVHAGGTDTIKIGLIGCGGRGTGAAANALHADQNIELVAMGDMFPDKLEASLRTLRENDVGPRVKVADDKKFTGWDAYKGVINAVDVVLLATPPFFRPTHVRAVVEAGKHCFCEKPVGTDPMGVKSVMEATKLATQKKVNLVSGLCYRYDPAKIDVMKQIHDGVLGDIINLQGNYLTTGLWSNPRKPEWSDMEWQLRNWLYFSWLSGDHIVEQHIHTIDKMMWAMKDVPPIKVTATGGRIQRVAPQFGNIYDHFNTIFEWEDGTKAFTNCRQFEKSSSDVSDYVFGSKATASVMQHAITDHKGDVVWRRRPAPVNMYDAEHVALFTSIRKGEAINNGDYMCKSTMAAIMARESAYTGKVVKWDEIMASEQNLAPAKLEFGPLATPPIAVPGETKIS